MNKWIKRIFNVLIILGILGLSGCLTRPLAADITALEGTTGYIGKEDINWGTGLATDTFTVTTYDGGSATLTKIPDTDAVDESVIKGVWYVAAMAGDHGNAALTGSLAWVIAVLDGDPATVVMPGNQTYQISTDLTVPATICLVMHRGAIFSVDAAKTLTINGDVLAGAYQIFSGAGTITLGANILEHDQWRDGAGDDILPSVTNTIDLGSTTQKFKDGHFEGDLNVGDDVTVGNDLTVGDDLVVTDQVTTARITGHPFPGFFVRPKFTWKDDDEIYISAGVYYHDGTTEQLLYWDSQITYQFTSLAASDWSYLYFDDSAIVTADTSLISASELTDSTTEPDVYSQTKHGRYSGNDLCFFAVLTDASSHIVKFYHVGNLIAWDQYIYNDGPETLPANFTDIPNALTLPVFARRALVHFRIIYVAAAEHVYWRVNGSSAAQGHDICYIANAGDSNHTMDVITDENHLIELDSTNGDGTWYIHEKGWYFPNNM